MVNLLFDYAALVNVINIIRFLCEYLFVWVHESQYFENF